MSESIFAGFVVIAVYILVNCFILGYIISNILSVNRKIRLRGLENGTIIWCTSRNYIRAGCLVQYVDSKREDIEAYIVE